MSIKFLTHDLKTLPEGSVSQNFNLGFSYFFLCYVEIFQIIFPSIFYVL